MNSNSRRPFRTPSFALVLAFAAVAALSVPVRAHEVAADGDGVPVAFAAAVVLPIVIGILGGVAAAVTGTKLDARFHGLFDACIGGLLVVLGITFALSTLTEHPALAVAGVVGGGFLARAVGARTDHLHHAELAVGTLVVHRTIEGVALVSLYHSGSTVGLVGALLIAAHAAFETIAVGGLYANRPWVLVGLVVTSLQVGFVAGVVAGTVLAVSAPDSLSIGLVAVGAGILLVVGSENVTARNRPTHDTPREQVH